MHMASLQGGKEDDMETVLQVMSDIGPYHWLALALLLVAVEMIMPTQYLMWPAISAWFVGMLGFVVDVPVFGEVAIFAVLSVGLTVVSQRMFPPASEDPVHGLNQRMEQIVGQLAVVSGNFQGGAGGVMLGDTRWAARSIDGSDLSDGARVCVVHAEGTLLVVRPVSVPTQ
jgi:membrane protein implicated in regulation of membrane protease activity